MTSSDLVAILPVLILSSAALALLLVDLLIPAERKQWTGWLALLAVGGGALGLLPWPQAGYLITFGGMLVADGFSLFLHVIFLIAGAATILLAQTYLRRTGIERGEFYVLLLFTLSGMMLMAQAADLIVVFLALELLSIPLYILAGFARPRLSSEESAMKYFLLGAFASGFLVYGIALVYGATGATNLNAILLVAHKGLIAGTDFTVSLPLLVLGAGLVLVGLSFKVAAAPFHMWTPDVYDGAPSVVTAFMSIGAKAGGFAALLRVFVLAFPTLAAQWVLAVAVISALTMTIANFAAIMQSNIKRLLAYSSIAHAGYILMGLVAAGTAALSEYALGAMLFYLFAYAVTNIGTWAIVMTVERAEGAGLTLSDYAGLSKRRPGLALAMTVFMLSLTGLPPTVGFIAKFYVFSAVLQAGYMGLAIVGVLTSLVSAYYYLRIIIVMYMQDGEGLTLNTPIINWLAGLSATATIVLGLLPTPMMDFAARSLSSLAR
jgi:NADH-quinone oxidoreductase subunit N